MSDEKENILESLLSAAKSRLGNPLIGSFIISWMIANWRFIAVLVAGDTPMEAKISLLDANYLPISRTVIAPLITAFALTLGYPYLDNIIERIRRKPLRDAERESIEDEIHALILRKQLSQENSAYFAARKEEAEQAASSDPELEVAKANLEFAEQQVRDIEGQKSSLDEEQYRIEMRNAHQDLNSARRRVYELRTATARAAVEAARRAKKTNDPKQKNKNDGEEKTKG